MKQAPQTRSRKVSHNYPCLTISRQGRVSDVQFACVLLRRFLRRRQCSDFFNHLCAQSPYSYQKTASLVSFRQDLRSLPFRDMVVLFWQRQYIAHEQAELLGQEIDLPANFC